MFGKSKGQQRRERESERLADAFEEWLEMIWRREFPPESKWREPWAVTLRNEITLQARAAIYKAAGNTGE